MERIGLADALDEGLGRRRNRVDPLRLLQRGDIGLRDFVDPVGRRQAVEQALAHDCEHLAGVLLHRRDRLGVAIIVLGQVLDKGAQLPRAVEIDIVLEVGDDDAGARAARQGVEQALKRADRQVAERGRADRLALRHLKIARQLVEQDQDGLVAEHGDPFVDAGRLRTVAPERRHDVAAPELLGDVAPQQGVRVLVAVEDDDLGRAEVGAACELRHDLATQGGIGREQPKRDQAVRLAAAHRLRQIERAVLALAGQPLEAAPDQELQAPP